MFSKWALIVVAIVGLATAKASENVQISAGFETGQFQPNPGRVDVFWITTLPENQIGSGSIRTGSGGGGPGSDWDTKVVRSDRVGGETVTPRKGAYFARSMLYRDKDYTELNDGLRKPRNAMEVSAQENRYNFDEEGWMGVSIFIPRNFEDEVARIGSPGSIEVIVSDTDSSAYFFNINIFVPVGQTQAHWVLQYVVDDKNVQGSPGEKRNVVLAPVETDKGKWTDFVIRYRSNPFSVDTNPSKTGIPNSNDKLYRANKGILQIWKSQGSVLANGSRKMVRKFSIRNAPVGQVPGTVQGESLLRFSLRVYKYGWQREVTSVAGPVWLGFDEFRFGQVVKNGTTYSDVHPSGLACTDKCPGGQVTDRPSPPKRPRGMVVTQ